MNRIESELKPQKYVFDVVSAYGSAKDFKSPYGWQYPVMLASKES